MKQNKQRSQYAKPEEISLEVLGRTVGKVMKDLANQGQEFLFHSKCNGS